MKKKFVVSFICLAFAVIWMVLSASVSSAKVYTSSEYKSLYDYSKTIAYTNLAGDRATQERTGYRYQHDLDDPIIRCGVEGGTCAMPATASQYLRVNVELSRFKVYLPPGTTSTDLTIFEDADAGYVAVARLGQPPTGDYANYLANMSNQDYVNLPTTGFRGSQLIAGDCIGRNNSGVHKIAVGAISVSTPADGGWLYVLLLRKSGTVLGNAFSNWINTGPFMSWFRTVDWTTFGGGSIITPTPTPTPTITPTPTPTGSPTPTPTPDCGPFGCGNNAVCIDGVCVPTSSPTPTPTPTAGCIDFVCLFQGGRCVNNVCVPNTPTPTPTPTPTTPPVSLNFDAKPLSLLTIEKMPCTNVDLGNIVPVLASSTPPSGNLTFYSMLLLISDSDSSMFFAQKDILQKEAFIYYVAGDAIKGHLSGAFPADGLWKDGAYKTLFGEIPGINCAAIADSGVTFLFGYAPDGDLTQFQGAAFTFATTP